MKLHRIAIVFTGHMVDLPGRQTPRFPPAMEATASREIAAAIDRQLEHVDPAGVIAISSLARGGDVLFQEHAGARKLSSFVVLPFEPEEFVKKSVAGVVSGDWEKRFWRIWSRVPQDHREILALAVDEDPYEACNRRQLEVARQASSDFVLIALSDGTADGKGGTQDLIGRARDAGGRVELIDSKKLLAAIKTAR